MLRKAAILVAVLAILGAAIGWFLTAPQPLQAAALPQHTPDPVNGERVFHFSGCRHCHNAAGSTDPNDLLLVGGGELPTPFGTFRVPNISPDPQSGIGGWTTLEFVNAVTRGVSPDGAHYYPAFPYASFARMRLEDVIDLKAYMDTLPAVASQEAGHDLSFPFNVRRGIGLWKRLFVNQEPIVQLADANDLVRRGQYLVEGPSHCGECHTARNFLGGMRTDVWLAGAPNPVGPGSVPNITPHEQGVQWSESEIFDALKSGFTPEFDTLGGPMAAVVADTSNLPDEDVRAIAAYLKGIPAHPDVVQPAPAQ